MGKYLEAFTCLRTNVFVCSFCCLMVLLSCLPPAALAEPEDTLTRSLPPAPDYGTELAQEFIELAKPRQENAIFRHANWGMSYDDVKSSETLPLQESEQNTFLGYRHQLKHSYIYVVYYFDGSAKLSEVHCYFAIYRDEPQDSLQDYTNMVAGFAKEFGPVKDQHSLYAETTTPDEARKNLPQAYQDGLVTTTTRWVIKPSAQVVLALYGTEAGISISAAFAPTKTHITAP